MRVTVWNEFRHEKESEIVAAIYPDGIHSVIAGFLSDAGYDVDTATLDEPEHGLTQVVLDQTDVLIWWGHKAHDEVDELEELLHRSIDNSVELFVHVDPCVPTSCHLCQKKDCPERGAVFSQKVEWTAELIMKNKKHGLL
jgi:trehalose utilization protein